MAMFVRLKRLNARRGVNTKTYTYKGRTFREARGWYKVPDSLAEELRRVKQDPYEDALPVFDVCTPEEAKRLHAEETAREQVKKGVDDANDFTAVDATEYYADAAAKPTAVSTADLTAGSNTGGVSEQPARGRGRPQQPKRVIETADE